MPNGQKSVDDKVRSIFRELAGDRATRLIGLPPSAEVKQIIAQAMTPDYAPEVAADIAFHLCDWTEDAAFLVAVHLFPERFTADEVKGGVINLIVHAPNHVAAAAKLAGYPIEDVFGLGSLSDDSS